MSTQTERLRWERLATLFDELIDAPATVRARRLTELAADDAALAAELGRMLEGDAADGPLDHTLPEPAPDEVAAVADRSGERVGPYRLLRHVGRGGMGEVYLAERAGGDFQQRVAIKLLKRGMDSDALLRRFARERRILAQLEHPNIARLLDGGLAEDGTPYFAMEYIDGVSITEHARDAGLGPRARTELLLQAADAVAHAQSRLVVHRDLKPSNILVGSDGRVRVLDFGIATLLDDSEEKLTGTGVGVLSPAYAAPEQMRGEPVTTATDVYALGGVLFELLSGRAPHPERGATPAAWLRALEHESAERPSVALRRSQPGPASGVYGGSSQERVARELRGDLDTIVLTALHGEPQRRYAGAAQLALDLRRYLDGRPIAARPDTAGYRLRKFVSRHRLGVGSASAVLLALIAGFGIALWQASVARDQASRADAEAQRAQQQAQRADAEARRAALVKEFVLSLFGEQDPVARAQARARSPGELVAAGLERAQAQFADEPALLAEVVLDLAEVQVALGEAAAADPTLRRVLEQRRAAGAEPADIAQAQLALANAELGQNRFAPARDLLREAHAVLAASPRHRLAAARADFLLTPAVNHTEGPEAALVHAQRAHAELSALRGSDDPEALESLVRLGTVYVQLDRPKDAEAAFSSAIAQLERRLGQDHARLVVPLGMLSDVLRPQRRYPEAAVALERGLAIARQHLPERHALLGGVLTRLGDLKRRMGDLDGAEAALAEAATCYPESAPHQGQIAMFRGGIERARGDHAAAAEAFAESHRRFRASLGDDSVFAWSAAVQQGFALLAAGHAEEAERLLQQVDARLATITPDSMETADVQTALGMVRLALERPADAEVHLRQALATRTRLFGADDPGTLEVLVAHARALRLAGREDEAAIALDEALAAPLPAPSVPQEAGLRLERASVYEQQGDAARVQQELQRIALLDLGSLSSEQRAQLAALRKRAGATDGN